MQTMQQLHPSTKSIFKKFQQQRMSAYLQDPHTPLMQQQNCENSVSSQNKPTAAKSRPDFGCANKLCKNHAQHSKQQQIEVNLDTLCGRCQEQFKNDSFCIYCKQIYFEQTDDGKEWIMCEECMRWVHSICADFNTKDNPNAVFRCIKCKKIESQPLAKKNILRNGYAKVERKKNSQFLTTIGFNWELSTNQTSDDMQQIKKYLI